ncbi:hypothetical protein J2752_001325 [Halarchaeum rubridurum]|uniref:Uncharacterized protein n=1 Tax=Halarchaeum rubridurum TaxID=489911 RepID=A0A8T4GQ90_9EURY|nr:hypothetical protein [Halarchaeum rubridurum]
MISTLGFAAVVWGSVVLTAGVFAYVLLTLRR